MMADWAAVSEGMKDGCDGQGAHRDAARGSGERADPARGGGLRALMLGRSEKMTPFGSPKLTPIWIMNNRSMTGSGS